MQKDFRPAGAGLPCLFIVAPNSVQSPADGGTNGNYLITASTYLLEMSNCFCVGRDTIHCACHAHQYY